MSKRYSGKSFKDKSVKKKPKLSIKEKRRLKKEKKREEISLTTATTFFVFFFNFTLVQTLINFILFYFSRLFFF